MRIKAGLTLLMLSIFFLQAYSFRDAEFIIRGRITDENGSPMTGAGVAVINTNAGAYSDYNGFYLIKVKSTGVYKLRFSYTGYEPVIKEITLPEMQVADITLYPRFTTTEEVIVSATRAGQKTPVTYSAISGDELSKNNLGQDLPFLIGMTPSLVETSEAGNGIGYTSFRIRGTDGSRINITLDGIPLNDAESQQVFWVDLPDLASSVDNIQVQRGVGTSSNGAGAFGASVNLQTKSIENKPFAEISSTVGSFNTFRNNIMAGTGLISGKFGFRLRYSDLKSDGYIKRTGSDNNAFGFSGFFKTERSLLKANFMTGNEHTGISWWGVPGEMLASDRRYNPAGEYTDGAGSTNFYNNESDNYRQNHYQLIFSHTINSFLNLHTALHYTRGEGYYEEFREDQLYSDYGLPPASGDAGEIISTDLIRRKWMKNDFYGLVYSFNYKRKRIEAVLGGGINNYQGDHFGTLIWMKNSGNTEKDYKWYFNDSEKGEYSIYGKISYKLNDRLTGYGDLQYRRISYEMRGPDDDLKDISQSHLYGFLNPKAGLYFSIAPQQDAYLSFSIAHKEPTRSDFKNASGDDKVTPHAEKLYDAEAGYLIKTNIVNFGLNVFAMYYKDQLVPTGQLSDVGYPIMTNVSKSFRTGVELTLSLKPAAVIDWNLNTTLSKNKIPEFTEHFTDYNTSDWSSRYTARYLGNVDIAYSPGITGSSDLAFIISEKMKIHLISKYVGRQYFDNTMSSQRMLDPYFVNNFRIDFEPAVKMIRNTELQLLINNIFNAKYESNAYGGNWYEDGNEKSWAYYFPQAGINFMVRLGLKF